MTLLKIAIGLFGLGIVVFFHELGHFLAARLCKIKVDAFSIGWGPPLLKKKIGEVEYRIGMLPIGGYCKFKGASDHGADEYKEAYDLYKEGKKPEAGSFLASTPQARMLTCFAGPFFNLLLAALLLSVIWGIGYEFPAFDNRIALLSETNSNKYIHWNYLPYKTKYPADHTGLKTGDRIIEITGKPVDHFHEIREIVALNPNKELSLIIEREGEKNKELILKPELNKSTGGGQIGVVPFSEKQQIIRTPKYNFFTAIGKGFSETWRSLTITVKSLRVLFMGVDLTQAVSGPARITYMMGDIASQGMSHGAWVAIHSFMEFIALISIALCIMNLLPLPIIDGGMIILFGVELIRKKPAHPKAVQIFQGIGIAFIFCLMIFALSNDILYFIKK